MGNVATTVTLAAQFAAIAADATTPLMSGDRTSDMYMNATGPDPIAYNATNPSIASARSEDAPANPAPAIPCVPSCGMLQARCRHLACVSTCRMVDHKPPEQQQRSLAAFNQSFIHFAPFIQSDSFNGLGLAPARDNATSATAHPAWLTRRIGRRPCRSTSPAVKSVMTVLTTPTRTVPMIGDSKPASRRTSAEYNMTVLMPDSCCNTATATARKAEKRYCGVHHI